MNKTRNSLAAMVALTALVVVEHDGIKYGPGQPAGTDFEASETEAAALLEVKAVKIYEANAAAEEGRNTEQEAAIAENVAAVLAQTRLDLQAAADAQAKADADAKAASEAQAKADADAQAVADERAKLDAEIKAFEEAKAAAAKAAAKKA
jgi:hypothetical protein